MKQLESGKRIVSKREYTGRLIRTLLSVGLWSGVLIIGLIGTYYWMYRFSMTSKGVPLLLQFPLLLFFMFVIGSGIYHLGEVIFLATRNDKDENSSHPLQR